MMQYPNKKRVYQKTFVAMSQEKIDEEVNEFREKNDAIATLINVVIDSKDTIHIINTIFYTKE